MTCPKTRAAAIKHCLEYVFSPDPRQGLGPMAERSEQTIEERRTTNIGPVHRSDFRPSEDEYNLVSKQPVPDVEILTGRAAL